MHDELPVLTVLLLLALTAATTFICLSGTVMPRCAKYDNGKAPFKHYVIEPAQIQQMPLGLMSVSN